MAQTVWETERVTLKDLKERLNALSKTKWEIVSVVHLGDRPADDLPRHPESLVNLLLVMRTEM